MPTDTGSVHDISLMLGRLEAAVAAQEKVTALLSVTVRGNGTPGLVQLTSDVSRRVDALSGDLEEVRESVDGLHREDRDIRKGKWDALTRWGTAAITAGSAVAIAWMQTGG